MVQPGQPAPERRDLHLQAMLAKHRPNFFRQDHVLVRCGMSPQHPLPDERIPKVRRAALMRCKINSSAITCRARPGWAIATSTGTRPPQYLEPACPRTSAGNRRSSVAHLAPPSPRRAAWRPDEHNIHVRPHSQIHVQAACSADSFKISIKRRPYSNQSRCVPRYCCSLTFRASASCSGASSQAIICCAAARPSSGA